jgi:tRNA (guanine9-N1)-methyltransferase
MKNLCLNKAQASGIRAARLPIGRYLSSLSTRKVLTVNQVFEILVKWIETRSWEDAFYSVIPKRKFRGDELHKGEAGDGPGEPSKERGNAHIGGDKVKADGVTEDEGDVESKAEGEWDAVKA